LLTENNINYKLFFRQNQTFLFMMIHINWMQWKYIKI